MKRTTIAVAAGLLAVGAPAAWWGVQGRDDRSAAHAAPEPESAASVAAEVVAAARLPRWLEVTGTVRTELEAPLATKVSGRVVDVLAREGDTVRRGQPLIRLDDRDFAAAVAQADANVRAASVGYDTARVAAEMETSTSAARIRAAEAQVSQSEAARKAAAARLDQVRTGARKQERAQAALAVAQAKAALDLAESNLKRTTVLYSQGAVAAQQLDLYRTQRDVAKAQYDTAVQAQSMTDEGSRQEEVRAAEEAVLQADAAVSQARAGLRQAQAAAMQVKVRRQEIRAADAQIGQSRAAARIARVSQDYAVVSAPFDGVVSARLADPGAIASPGTPLLKVQGGRTRLEAVVPETALKSVRKGGTLTVVVDALGNREVTGRVAEIAPQGDPASHTFVAKIDLPTRIGLRAGMYARARVLTGVDSGLLVSASAVVEREGLRYVYVLGSDNTARLRLVTVGDAAGGRLPVLSGLKSGERIVTDAAAVAADGQRVAVR